MKLITELHKNFPLDYPACQQGNTCNIAQHSTAQYKHSTAAQQSRAQHITAQHITPQHSTSQHIRAQHSIAQYSTAHHSTAGATSVPLLSPGLSPSEGHGLSEEQRGQKEVEQQLWVDLLPGLDGVLCGVDREAERDIQR
jgi:hypothetical protein